MSWRAKIDREIKRFRIDNDSEPTEIMLTKNLANPVAIEKGLNVKDLKEYESIFVSVHNYIFLPVDNEGVEQEVVVDADIDLSLDFVLGLINDYSISIYIK